ncbi:hypothetical protein [Acidovorax sp.]|uniref:hypothetical protein n=1 Tax=Acidovorax sp. TaxID=1872122 RepID=UPI00391FBBA2
MSDEHLQSEVLRLKGTCRQSQEDSGKPGSPCQLLALAENAAKAKGWCWGPQAAANVDMSWMRCEEDVTGRPEADGVWFASTNSGACRETSLAEAIGKVLPREGPPNVKTWITPDRVFNVSNRSREGDVSSVQLFTSCGAALMAQRAYTERPDGVAVAAPLGFSLLDAAAYFGFDARNCSRYSVGRGIGCNMAFADATRAPITLNGGFTPCTDGRAAQFDFDAREILVGVTCVASAESQAALRSKLNTALGQAKTLSSGSLLWTMEGYSVRSSEDEVLGQVLRRTSVFMTAR